MPEYLGGDYLYTTLSADAGIIALVGTNVYRKRILPEDCEDYDTINFYLVGGYNAAAPFFSANWSVDCRSESEYTALTIANTVVEVLNRHTEVVGGYTYFATCEILAAIPPQNEQDVYNYPVQILIRRR